MRYPGLSICLLLLSTIYSCNTNTPGKPVKLTLVTGHDSTRIETIAETGTDADTTIINLPGQQAFLDSVMRIEVTLPPLLDDKAYDSATVNTFTRLAATSKGEMRLLVSAKLLQENITRILCSNSADYADVLFLVDNTGSMTDDIEEVKAGLSQIIDVLKDKKQVRLAIAIYRDKQYDSTNWFAFRNFELDYDSARSFVNNMQLIPNNDLPESVYEAFFASADQKFWRSRTKRIVLIVGDARGKDKSEGGEYTLDDVIRKAGESKIKVNFFPLIVTPYSEQYRSHDTNPKPATQVHLIDRIYPNPVTGPLHMQFASSGRYHVEVFNMAGVMIEEVYIDGDYWMVETANRANGLYVIRVIDKNNQYDAGKFVVQH